MVKYSINCKLQVDETYELTSAIIYNMNLTIGTGPGKSDVIGMSDNKDLGLLTLLTGEEIIMIMVNKNGNFSIISGHPSAIGMNDKNYSFEEVKLFLKYSHRKIEKLIYIDNDNIFNTAPSWRIPGRDHDYNYDKSIIRRQIIDEAQGSYQEWSEDTKLIDIPFIRDINNGNMIYHGIGHKFFICDPRSSSRTNESKNQNQNNLLKFVTGDGDPLIQIYYYHGKLVSKKEYSFKIVDEINRSTLLLSDLSQIIITYLIFRGDYW